MLNELHDLAHCLKAVNVSMASWHMHFKTCPKGTATFFVLFDSLGQVADLEPVTDRERLASIRKWEVAAGTSFPAFNVLPLYEPSGEEGKKSAVELRKAVTSKSPPKSDEIKQRLESLVGISTSLWVKKEPARITKCLTTLANEVGQALGAPSDDFRAILELIVRTGKLTAEIFQTQLAAVLTNKIISSPNLAAEWFDALFFHSGKVAKKWSVIAELADRSAFAYPANHERVQVWMTRAFRPLMNRHGKRLRPARTSRPMLLPNRQFDSTRAFRPFDYQYWAMSSCERCRANHHASGDMALQIRSHAVLGRRAAKT